MAHEPDTSHLKYGREIDALQVKISKLKAVLMYHLDNGDLDLHERDEDGDIDCPQDDTCDCPRVKAFNDAMRDD